MTTKKGLHSMKLTEDIRYGWLAAVGSVVWLAIFLSMQFTANQHIPQEGNVPTVLAIMALCAIFAMFIGAMMILAKVLDKELKLKVSKTL